METSRKLHSVKLSQNSLKGHGLFLWARLSEKHATNRIDMRIMRYRSVRRLKDERSQIMTHRTIFANLVSNSRFSKVWVSYDYRS
jgi:hypothetical protein